MVELKRSVKYEVVIGVPRDEEAASMMSTGIKMYTAWQRYADEFFEKTGVYVSTIAHDGAALYKTEWGCPVCGEVIITFNSTANPEFIKDLDMYEKGVLYITKKLKKEFKQHTITITKLPAEVFYLTDADNEEE